MNRSGSLKWLIWLAVLIGILVAVLDARDRLVALEEERVSVDKRRQRELAAVAGIDWAQEARRAERVRGAWLDRLPESANPAVTRVKLMEQVGRLCEEARLQCEVAQLNEGSQEASPYGRAGAGATLGKSPSASARVPGLSAHAFRVATNFTPEGLLQLMDRIETGEQLYSVQALAVRNNRIELKLTAYSLDAREAQRLRALSPAVNEEVLPR